LRGGEREGAEWVVREGVGAGGAMTQALYAHMNNKTIKKKRFYIWIATFP
jgi:NaMN:DMB phosphoribosyltransferase